MFDSYFYFPSLLFSPALRRSHNQLPDQSHLRKSLAEAAVVCVWERNHSNNHQVTLQSECISHLAQFGVVGSLFLNISPASAEEETKNRAQRTIYRRKQRNNNGPQHAIDTFPVPSLLHHHHHLLLLFILLLS